jgi:hypothetical protein
VRSAIILVFLIIGSLLMILGCHHSEPTLPSGPVWDAVQKTVNLQIEPNPVKEDLIQRGLVVFHSGIAPSTEIHLEEIEQLVNDGVYVIDEDGYLQFGPSYKPNER